MGQNHPLPPWNTNSEVCWDLGDIHGQQNMLTGRRGPWEARQGWQL